VNGPDDGSIRFEVMSMLTEWQAYYHVVWGTKRREQLITGQRIEPVRASLTATALEHDATIHAIGIMPDHVHLAISIRPEIAEAELIGRLKVAARRRVTQESERSENGFDWDADYGVLTFGPFELQDVVSYVENQREIHDHRSTRPSFEQTETPRSCS
jgi:putative transposase